MSAVPVPAGVAEEVVRRLLVEQVPELAGLGLRRVDDQGWDNTTYRLGDELVVRLPNHDGLVAQVEKEQRWLPVLAGHLPLPIPTPVAAGRPGPGFPRPWSVHRWVAGEPLGQGTTGDPVRLAGDLVSFLAALRDVPADGGPAPGPHSYGRGGPLARFDADVHRTLDRLEGAGRIDTAGARAVWVAASDTTSVGPAVWVHGDVTGSNLLVADGRLAGVIDFGCMAVGDPVCDLAIAWTTFDGASRSRFLEDVDDATRCRARAWALWKAVKRLPDRPDDHPRNDGRRLGWRWPAVGVVEELIADHRCR